jgi:alpha-tubulin suppressor-like RCC1 family protein
VNALFVTGLTGRRYGESAEAHAVLNIGICVKTCGFGQIGLPSIMKLRRVLLALIAATTGLVAFASPSFAASGWTSLSSGGSHTCGIRNGRIYCWGNDASGQLGDGTAGGARAVPAQISSGATDWTSVSAGSNHTCATRVGRVACWGSDQYGQLGDGTSGAEPDAVPNLIASGATDWKSVSAGGNHTCAVRIGRVACWGHDQSGQLGDGTAAGTADASPGFIASGASDWTSVSAGGGHTCAIRSKRVACWGDDSTGQLGDGTSGGSDPSPGLIASGAADWTSVSAGGFHTCATRVGRVACWGYDAYGALGDGTADGPTSDASPGFISSGATDWKRVDTGDLHTCAIRATVLACWGYDNAGQLGDGTGGVQADPIPNLEVS